MALITLASERWLDEVLFTGSFNNVDGDLDDFWVKPAGFGDVAIMEIDLVASGAATLVALAGQDFGVRARIRSADGATVIDFVGSAPWWRNRTTSYSALISPDPLVLWRQDEQLVIESIELDSNVTPTIDYFTRVKCVRVRPQVVSEQPQPLRLVR